MAKYLGYVWGTSVVLGRGAFQAEGTAGEQSPKERGSRSSEDQKQATVAGTVTFNEHERQERPAWTSPPGKMAHSSLDSKIKRISSIL